MATGTQSIGRFAAFACALTALVAVSGCSSPKTASGGLEAGKQRVTALVLDAAHALPASTTFTAPTLVGTQVCRRSFAGFGAGLTGAHRAQVPLIVYMPKPNTPSLSAMFDPILAAWKESGYRIDRSRIDEDRFNQVRATARDGDQVVATAFSTPFVVKVGGEQYVDYVRRARAADVDPEGEDAWDVIEVGTKLPDHLIATQIDLYAVSPCLRGS